MRPHQPLNRNLDHNWQQALLKTSSERRIAVDVTLSGWQEQLVLTMTCEDGVSVTHTLDGEFAEANQAEKALANLRDGVTKLGQTIYYARDVQVSLPPLFVPNSLLNQLRRETAEMLDEARLNAWQRGTRKPVSVPPPVYPETHLSFLANVYNHKARAFYQRYGVQLIDAAYEAHEEKGDVPVMITKHCLRFAFNLCPKQAKGSIKSWKATPMQLIHGDEVLTLKFDCRPCEMRGRQDQNHILKCRTRAALASVSPDDLMKTLPKRKGPDSSRCYWQDAARFTVVLPAVMFAQVCGGLLVLAAKLIAIRFVQQLLFETLHRKVLVSLTMGQQMPGK